MEVEGLEITDKSEQECSENDSSINSKGPAPKERNGISKIKNSGKSEPVLAKNMIKPQFIIRKK